MIRPFNEIQKRGKGNGLVTESYLWRALQSVLGKLHFTGNVRQDGDGHIHFDGGGGANTSDDCDFPLKVYESEKINGFIKVQIQPGYVKSEITSAIYPTIQGVPINRPINKPWITVSTALTITQYVVLDLTYWPTTSSTLNEEFVYFSGAAISSATISVMPAPPQDTQPSIDWEKLVVNSPGLKRVTLATIAPGGAISQAWWGNMHVLLLNTGAVWINAAA